MLHITNGDSTIQGFREGHIHGDYLAWADALTDGAVPATETLEELSEIRAKELSRLFGVNGDVRATLAARDNTLKAFEAHAEVVLWFEHDLYDQLQLIQLLDWFADRDATRVSIIQIGTHPEIRNFQGLGELSGRQLADLLPARRPVSRDQLDTARRAWRAFRAPDPTALATMADDDQRALPFLAGALGRFLEEYPSPVDGLSRTERQLLRVARDGARSRRDLYRESQKLETCVWGDASVFIRLDDLASGQAPALDRIADDEFALTDLGAALLNGAADWIQQRSETDRWLGGVRMTGRDVVWRFDPTTKRLCR